MHRYAAALAGALLALTLAPATAEAAQPATWNFSQIRIGRAQAAGRNGSGVTVAVLDTWIEASHPDLGGRVGTGADCASGTCTRGSAPPDACEAHGTHVAGTVASSTYGVAPAARILPIRVLKWNGKECVGTSRGLRAAIRYAVARRVQVVNISAGAAVPLSGRDTDLDAAVTEAAEAGVLVVFAAGNGGYPVADTYGGGALIVAATDRGGALADYSQHGTGVDLAAPGGEGVNGACDVRGCVVSTWDEGRYAALAGTSMAAPHVAGVAALLYAQRPRTRGDVVARLRDTARPLSGAGDGLIDAAAALGASAAPPPAATNAPPASTVVRVSPAPRPQARTAAPRVTVPAPRRTAAATPTSKPRPTPSATTAAPAPTAPPATAEASAPEPAAERRDRGSSRTFPIALATALRALTVAGPGAAADRAPGRRR
jgi:subtilisin family serine protease